MDTPKVFETAIAELERMLNSKSVVGEPIKIDGTTILPLVSIGFGFGVGAGEGIQGKNGQGHGGGAAGGGGVKPIAVIIVDAQGARLESVKTASSVLAKVADSVTGLARAKLAAGAPPRESGT